ncbi:uncharacterized protein VNE69_07229 [Vairimorpha necatrix]|uniref:Membrane protein n=1 Tax=Vairimorpha necatrix TaxID=6039 RepID=A0AAX4JE92_9MICR
MDNFFFWYMVIYYIDLIQFIVYSALFHYRDIKTRGTFIPATFYLSFLQTFGFISLSQFYFKKEFTSLLTVVLLKVESLIAYLYINISSKFWLPIITNIVTDLMLAFCIYYFWPVVYSIILQSYNRKIGVDIKIRDVYIMRRVYSSLKRISYILYLVLLFVKITTLDDNFLVKYQFHILALPILIVKVLEREEEEEENKIAKFSVIFLLFIISGLLIFTSVIQFFGTIHSEFRLLNFINSVHFSLATCASIVDYSNYGKGLKEAIKYKKDGATRRL